MIDINAVSGNEFEFFFDIAIDLLCILDKDSTLKRLNHEWESTLGYKISELQEKKLFSFIHPDDMPSTLAAFQTISEGRHVSDFENRCIGKDGSIKWLEWRILADGGLVYASARDITDRKIFEKEIADTLQFNSKIFHSSPIGIATYNSHGQCKSANKAYAKFFSESLEDILELSITGLAAKKRIHPAGFSKNVLNIKDELQEEIHFTKADGERLWFSCNITAFQSNGELHSLLLMQDITRSKKSSMLLQDSENQLKNLLGNVKLMSVIVDTEGRIKFINDFALNYTGFSEKEVMNKNGIDLFVYDADQRIQFKNYLHNDTIPDSVDAIITTKSSGNKILKWSATPLRNEDNKLTGVALIGKDITEIKLFEEILNFRYELFERENTNDIDSLIQFTLDTAEKLTDSKISVFRFYNGDDGTVVLQNGSTKTIGLSNLKSLLGRNYNVETAGVWSESITERQPVIHNDLLNRHNKMNLPRGHPAIERELVYPVIKDDKIVAVVSIGNKETDYTQNDIEIVSLLCDSLWNILYKKKTTDTLKKSEEKLRALNITKDKFFSIIAHDLKSPFQGMLGSLQILSSEFDYLSNDESKLLIGSIDKLSQYTYKLLENLLQWSRIQTEHMEYNIQILNLKNAFNDTLEFLSNVAQTKNITINMKIPDDFFVKADLNVALTVFRNLLSNAVKFTDSYGKINIDARQRDGLIEVFVEDNGIGMSKEELENLFLIQKQHNKPGTGGETGTGLGLIICKEMIERIGGDIYVKSEWQKGTTFSFTLPKI